MEIIKFSQNTSKQSYHSKETDEEEKMKAEPEVEANHDYDEDPEAGVDAHEEGGDAAGVRLPQRHLV